LQRGTGCAGFGMKKTLDFFGLLPAKGRSEPAAVVQSVICRKCKIHAGFDNEDPNICTGDDQVAHAVTNARRGCVLGCSCSRHKLSHCYRARL